MKRFLFFLLIMLLFPILGLFAGGDSEGKSGYSIYYIPSNVANSQNVLVELTEAKSVNASSVGKSFSEATQYSYGSDNLVICCLMDTLKDSVQSSNVNLTITSDDATGFFFKKDGNETVKVPFEIEICCVAFYKGNNKTDYSSTVLRKKMSASSVGDVSQEPISYETTRQHYTIEWLGFIPIPKTETEINPYDEQTSFTWNSAGQYTLSVSPSSLSNTMDTDSLSSLQETNEEYPNLIKYYYVCLKIANNPNLEEGLYTASITLNAIFTKQELNAEASSGTISEIINIKGYVGEKPEGSSDLTYSFFVSPGANTYYMNLETVNGETIPAYDIARLQFNYTYLNSTSDDPASTTRRQKYVIYISPTSSIYTDGKYAFRRNGTEAQLESFGNTVEYDLYLETSAGNYELISSSGHDYTGNGNNSASNAAAHYTSGMIGGAGKASNSGDHTYYLYPVYDRLQTSTGTNSKYKETWTLDQHIYLKINSDQTEIFEGDDARMHQTGSYTSAIYFTVVTN